MGMFCRRWGGAYVDCIDGIALKYLMVNQINDMAHNLKHQFKHFVYCLLLVIGNVYYYVAYMRLFKGS